MSTQYRLVQSGKTASGGCSAGQGSSEPVAPRIYLFFIGSLPMMMMMTTLVSEHYVRKYLRDSYVLLSIHLFEITLLLMKFIKFYTLHAYCNVSIDILFLHHGDMYLPIPRGLRRRSVAALLFGSRVQVPLSAWIFVSCVYMLCCPV
jgi:hypothetical protein